MTVSDTVSSNSIKFLPNVQAGNYNALAAANDCLVTADSVLTLAPHCNNRLGVRMDANTVSLGATTSGTLDNGIVFNATNKTVSINSPNIINFNNDINLNGTDLYSWINGIMKVVAAGTLQYVSSVWTMTYNYQISYYNAPGHTPMTPAQTSYNQSYYFEFSPPSSWKGIVQITPLLTNGFQSGGSFAYVTGSVGSGVYYLVIQGWGGGASPQAATMPFAFIVF
jgi:hypothetical protein